MGYIEDLINDPYARSIIGVVSSRGGRGDSYFIEISKGSGKPIQKFAIHEGDVDRFKGIISSARDLQAVKKEKIKNDRKLKKLEDEKIELDKLG